MITDILTNKLILIQEESPCSKTNPHVVKLIKLKEICPFDQSQFVKSLN